MKELKDPGTLRHLLSEHRQRLIWGDPAFVYSAEDRDHDGHFDDASRGKEGISVHRDFVATGEKPDADAHPAAQFGGNLLHVLL